MIVIAEIGVNHNGDVSLAKELIDQSAEAGADIVKFQTFKAKNIVSKFAEQADYQKRNTGSSKSQLELVKSLELPDEAFLELAEYSRSIGTEFLSTAFDVEALEFLDQLDLGYIKIPSGDITNLPLLEEIGKRKKKVIMSTGMATLDEVRAALDVLLSHGTSQQDVTVLQCTTQYPTPDADINLAAMVTLGRELDLSYGLSDHSEGPLACIGAAALGATILEKHVTLDRQMAGPDHKASMEMPEFRKMCADIRRMRTMMGTSEKIVTESDRTNITVARKSIVARSGLKSGHVLRRQDLDIKRPAVGISPMEIYAVIGKRLTRDVEQDEALRDGDVV